MKTLHLTAKWSFAGDKWHWCVGYRGPTLCGIKKMKSVGECAPSVRNAPDACKSCVVRVPPGAINGSSNLPIGAK